jgi:type II secretory pathway pseudopilin PulG
MRLRLILERIRRGESGSMLIELLIAMTFLAVAVGALMSLYASTVVTMRHASTEGNALTLADRQIEVYKTLPYAEIMLSSSTIPSGSDPYVTANASDSTIPSSTGQVTGGTTPSSACTAPSQAMPECATQTWTGPDGLDYRIDSYIVTSTPTGGRAVKEITVTVRRVTSGTPSSQIWSRATSEFDQANPPQT